MASVHGGSEDYMWLAWPVHLTLWLAWHLCDLVGVDWPIGRHVASPASLRLIYTVNSVALGLVGALVAVVFRIVRPRKDTNAA
jgi:hypothetical protein